MSRTSLLDREEQVFAYMAIALGGGMRQAVAACRRSRADIVRTLRRNPRFARRWRRAQGFAVRLPPDERLMEGALAAPYGAPSVKRMLRDAERAYRDDLLAEPPSPLLGWEFPPIDPAFP
jgi:hypothetical protein